MYNFVLFIFKTNNVTSSTVLMESFIKLFLFPCLVSDPAVSRPTPLYGQPSWWGEDDEEKGERCDPSAHEHHPGLDLRLMIITHNNPRHTFTLTSQNRYDINRQIIKSKPSQ